MLSMGYVFGLFTLGGCGGSQVGFAPAADGRLPERVVDRLTDCTQRRGPTALQSVSYTVSFDVFMNSDGQVEDVALRSSTFHLDELEACMTNALHALSERAVDASLRRREPASQASLPPETRGLFANPLVLGVGSAQVVFAVGVMAVTVVVFYYVVRNTQTRRPPPPTLQIEEPPNPEPPKPEPQTAGDPKTTGPTPPVPPKPPPPPKEEKETCREKRPDIIRCDDPKIRYDFWSENAAFNEIVKKLGKGVRKAKKGDAAERGPCIKRGGFHTNVLRAGGSVASIVGCDCCDDSSGKAIKKERAGIVYKP